jgi:hypothetical protein
MRGGILLRSTQRELAKTKKESGGLKTLPQDPVSALIPQREAYALELAIKRDWGPGIDHLPAIKHLGLLPLPATQVKPTRMVPCTLTVPLSGFGTP